MNSLQEEFDGLMNDKKESEEILNNNMNSFANEIKNGLGDRIKEELLHPTTQPIKKTRKEKRKEKWEKLKGMLNNYFFSQNNDILLNDNE